MSNLQSDYFRIHESVPYLESVLKQREKAFSNEEKVDQKNPFVFQKSIQFLDVSFYYDSHREILKNIRFDIKKGAFIGLIGPSGGGKTTVVDLLLRLFEPTGGRILLDGEDAKNINLKEWRRSIGYVSQDVHLFNDTVENNIKFYDPSVSDEDMISAAQMANIHSVIQGLPNGFKTVIGERGVLLSAGQRQRIAIARVLARKPQLIVLDEATSALDAESEKEIQKAIENLKGTTTVLAIAHRFGTIMGCDEVLVLEGRRLIEKGKPDLLLKDSNSYFYKVHTIGQKVNI